jgi:hypothetical protein
MPSRTNQPYKDGELEVVLSLAPTDSNIRWLGRLLDRSEAAIIVIYRIAFEHGPFGRDDRIQVRKVLAAKRRVGIRIGRVRAQRVKRNQVSRMTK